MQIVHQLSTEKTLIFVDRVKFADELEGELKRLAQTYIYKASENHQKLMLLKIQTVK